MIVCVFGIESVLFMVNTNELTSLPTKINYAKNNMFNNIKCYRQHEIVYTPGVFLAGTPLTISSYTSVFTYLHIYLATCQVSCVLWIPTHKVKLKSCMYGDGIPACRYFLEGQCVSLQT
jgi:hypothetical protein